MTTGMSRHERFGFASPAALLEKIADLGLAIPFSDDISALLRPIELGGRQVPNCLVVQPMEGHDADDRTAPGPLTVRRYRRYAAGGSGLIWFEATAVVPEGRAHPRQLCLSVENESAFGRLVQETRQAAEPAFGTGHRPVLILQLTHSGRYARPDGVARPVIARHADDLDALVGIGPEHPLISDEALDELQDAYVRAAERAAAAGFDGVDVKACHGYLVGELLAAFTREGSRYGGCFENRTRFLLDVVRRIRERLPELIVSSRISGFDGGRTVRGFGVDREDATKEDLAEPVALASRLHAAGCPLLNVTVGDPHRDAHLSRPYEDPVDGATLPAEHPLEGVARLVRVAGTVQQAVPALAVVGSGYSWLREYWPSVAAAIVKEKQATLVGVGRCAFAYPDFAKDLMTRGALDPKRVCLTCSRCSQIMRDGGCAGCVVRDAPVYAEIYREGRRRARREPAE